MNQAQEQQLVKPETRVNFVSNSLVVIASQSDYRNLVKVVERLDIRRRQVFVEAVIMEVNLENDTDFGVSA